jgi:hypothetical protein
MASALFLFFLPCFNFSEEFSTDFRDYNAGGRGAFCFYEFPGLFPFCGGFEIFYPCVAVYNVAIARVIQPRL